MGSHWKALTVIIIIALLTLAYVPSSCLSENYGFSYQLIDYHDNSKHYRLNVAVPESLYEYYAGKNHQLITENDFAKFVTPYALKPIADSLLEIYSGNEDFANGVLMIIHQIFYQATSPSRYPVETIAKNEGDCDLLSYVLASILKAAGLDSVLLYYEHESHMNVGVYLESPPQDSRGEVYYVIHHDKKYYTAECTGNNWQSGWRVPRGIKTRRCTDYHARKLRASSYWTGLCELQNSGPNDVDTANLNVVGSPRKRYVCRRRAFSPSARQKRHDLR